MNITYTFAGVGGKNVDVSVPLGNYIRGFVDPDSTEDVYLFNLEMGGCTFGAPFRSAAAILIDDEGDRLAFAQAVASEEGDGVNEDLLGVLDTSGKCCIWESL